MSFQCLHAFQVDGLPDSYWQGFCLSFLTQLDRSSHPVVQKLVCKHILMGNTKCLKHVSSGSYIYIFFNFSLLYLDCVNVESEFNRLAASQYRFYKVQFFLNITFYVNKDILCPLNTFCAVSCSPSRCHQAVPAWMWRATGCPRARWSRPWTPVTSSPPQSNSTSATSPELCLQGRNAVAHDFPLIFHL